MTFFRTIFARLLAWYRRLRPLPRYARPIIAPPVKYRFGNARIPKAGPGFNLYGIPARDYYSADVRVRGAARTLWKRLRTSEGSQAGHRARRAARASA